MPTPIRTIGGRTANLPYQRHGNNQNIAQRFGHRCCRPRDGHHFAATNGVSWGAVSISGYLGTGTMTVAASATVKRTADQMNSLQSTGVTATARTEVRCGMASAGSYS